MGGRDHVHADVRDRAGKCEHEKRRALAKRCRRQTARSEQASSGDERPSAVPRSVAPITPPPHEERHGEAGRRVHHHHQPDQRRGFSDVREQQREVGRRHGPDEAGADCRRGEDEQVGEAASRTKRQRENARESSRYKGIARDGATYSACSRDHEQREGPLTRAFSPRRTTPRAVTPGRARSSCARSLRRP
jgi:hypothetical protein